MTSSELEQCIASGGVAIIPTDTVYGLACSSFDSDAVNRIYELKGRPMDKPAAVMFASVEKAFATLPALGPRTGQLLKTLLPGGFTFLLPNPDHLFPLACGPEPTTLGIRVPYISPNLSALENLRTPILQTSANLSGEPDPRRINMIPEDIRTGVDLVIDRGELPGTPSTVVDLRRFEGEGEWRIIREGAVPGSVVDQATSEVDR